MPFVVLAAIVTGAHAQATFADVAPIFAERCVMCHSGADAPLGVRLDSHAAALEGGSGGPVIVPGDAEGSELVRRIRGTSVPRMPLTGPPFLTDEEIDRIARWIDAGAPPPADEPDRADSASPPDAEPATPADGAGRDGAEPPGATPEPVTFTDVEPILLQRCASCHSDGGVLGRPPEGLRLDSYDAVLAGAERVVIVPGSPGASELMRRIVGQALPRMPFDGPPYLDAEQEDLIRRWIAEGARDAEGRPAAAPAGAEVRLHGTITGHWRLDELPLTVGDGARLEGDVVQGAYVEVRGVLEADGTVRVERIRTR